MRFGSLDNRRDVLAQLFGSILIVVEEPRLPKGTTVHVDPRGVRKHHKRSCEATPTLVTTTPLGKPYPAEHQYKS